MTVTVTCPRCHGECPTEVEALVRVEGGTDAVLEVATFRHDIEWHIEEMMGA